MGPAGADSRALAERMPRAVGADGNAPVRVFACRPHVPQGSRADETQQLDLLRWRELVERHLGKIRPDVDLVVLRIAPERQRHLAGIEDLGERGQDLATFAVARDLFPMRDRVTGHRRNPEVGLELVELPGVP